MRDILTLYFKLISIQLRSQMQYKLSFLMEFFATGMASLIGFLTLALVIQKFQHIAGWNIAEIAFLYSMVECAFGFMDMLFSGFDPPAFGSMIRQGTLDQLLLRPSSLIIQILGSRFILRRFARIVQGSFVFVFALIFNDIHWTLLKIIYLPIVFISLVAFFGGLFIVGATITFWTIESIEFMNIFTYGGTEMMTYPMEIYPDWMSRFFTYIIPAIFLNYLPALYFLDKMDPFNFPPFAQFLAPLAGFGVLLLAIQFWNYGIRQYQSTGS